MCTARVIKATAMPIAPGISRASEEATEVVAVPRDALRRRKKIRGTDHDRGEDEDDEQGALRRRSSQRP